MDSHKTHKAFVQMVKWLEPTSGHNECCNTPSPHSVPACDLSSAVGSFYIGLYCPFWQLYVRRLSACLLIRTRSFTELGINLYSVVYSIYFTARTPLYLTRNL